MISEILHVANLCNNPQKMQQFLKQMPYNNDKIQHTLSSANSSLLLNRVHCFEAAFIAAAVLEVHGFPPIVMSIESQDGLDHVLFVFQHRNKWGSIGRSRDPGLHGRAPVYRSLWTLAWSYFDPYIDGSGRITGYQIAHLDETACDWRFSSKNVWQAETFLNTIEHEPLRSSDRRYNQVLANYQKNGAIKKGKNWW